MPTTNNYFSLIIIAKGRSEHLRNVLASLPHCRTVPSEVIIVHMNEPSAHCTSDVCAIKETTLLSDQPLPLAHARNKGAKLAKFPVLIFLDIDCIPSADFFETIMTPLRKNTVVMCDPRYLTNPVKIPDDYLHLQKQSYIHTARKHLSLGSTDNYDVFWSLGFAIHRETFISIGGFDQTYTGYGGEDTDFSYTLKQHCITLYLSGAKVYHQPHPSYNPPLNWLPNIVQNARTFYDKWGILGMKSWLDEFERLGYISIKHEDISINRLPTHGEIEAHRSTN